MNDRSQRSAHIQVMMNVEAVDHHSAEPHHASRRRPEPCEIPTKFGPTPILERILQRKLHDARIARRCNLTKCRTVHGRRRKDPTTGIEKTRMVEHVEYLRPE